MIAKLTNDKLRGLGAAAVLFLLSLSAAACSGGGSSGGGSTASTAPSGDPSGAVGGSAAAADGSPVDGSGSGGSGAGGGSGSGSGSIVPQAFPGGFIEKSSSTTGRPMLSAAQIQSFLPAGRGAFTFPAPYNTRGVRLTIPSDCGGADCVNYVGYSYWRNTNNHVGSDTMYIFLGLNPSAGGSGVTLFSYNKTTDVVTKVGPIFPAGNPLGAKTGEQWYFSATMPTKMYVFDPGAGSALLRHDVLTKQTQTVFDVNTYFGGGKYIWQPHSSNDDNVHMATVRNSSSYAMEGCIVYIENTQQFRWFPASGSLDECNLDKSGRWFFLLESTTGSGTDNVIIDLQTNQQTILTDPQGAAAHLDTGFGIMVGEDNWNSLPGAARLYTFGQTPIPGPVVFRTPDWSVDVGHVTFQNANSTLPADKQHACTSNSSRNNVARSNEIVCFQLNPTLDTLVVAPTMTDLNSSGGGSDDYSKRAMGNIDITGQYFIWTSNMTSSRQDAFIVKVPSLLFGN